jgi:hypothetical protein
VIDGGKLLGIVSYHDLVLTGLMRVLRQSRG